MHEGHPPFYILLYSCSVKFMWCVYMLLFCSLLHSGSLTMYVLIEFHESDGGGIAVVNKKWLTPRKREVFWPPVKEQKQFNKIVKSIDDADTESWRLYPVYRCFYETDDFDKAQEKLKLAEVSSDILTDINEEPIKRKRVAPRRIYSSDDEDSRPPTPPRLKKRKIVAAELIESAGSTSDITNSSLPVKDPNISTPSTSVQTDRGHYFSDSAAYQQKLLGLLTYLKEQNTEILSLLREKSLNNNYINNISRELPLASQEDLETFEDQLRQKQNLNNLITYLSSLGGRDLASKTNRVMRHLLSDSVATNYNFYGKRSNKKAFCTLRLRDAVIGAIKLSTPQSTDKDIEDTIKVWLKHAPERIKGQNRRQRN